MKPNIIFVLLDGARWDRISTSREFMELSKEGTILNNISTAIPYTIGSVNVTFSGLYGKENGIDAYYKMFRLKESIKILPEILKENGYFTACDLLSNKIVTKRGFDIHQAHDEYTDDLTIRHPEFIKNCHSQCNEKPLFMFLHFTRIHTITVSEVLKKYEWDDEEFYNNKDENFKKYDAVFDESAKYALKIKNTIKEIGIDGNTILIFFSDHGTGIGERFGERNYGSFTYEETIRTFFLFSGKNVIPDRCSDCLRETIDIFPTILDLADINAQLERPGVSFSDYLVDGNTELKEKQFTFSETGALHGPYPSPKEPNVFCIKTPESKLMFLKTPNEWRFFDLKNDPNELTDIFDENNPNHVELKKKLLEWVNR